MSEDPTQDISPEVAAPVEEQAPKPAQPSPNPSNPVDHLREQAIALVPEESRAQMASLIRSIVDLYAQEKQPAAPDDSPRVRARFSMLPVKPKVTKEEGARVPDSYDFFKSNED